MRKIIFGLIVCMALSSFASNADINQFEKPASESELNIKTSTSLKIKELIFWLNKIINLLSNANFRINASSEVNKNSQEDTSSRTNGSSEANISSETNIGSVLNTSPETSTDSESKSYLKNPNFTKLKKELTDLNKALQNKKAHRNTILGKGDRIFNDNQFFRSENIPSGLKELYADTVRAWEKIRYEEISNEKLDNFREKISLLYQHIQN